MSPLDQRHHPNHASLRQNEEAALRYATGVWLVVLAGVIWSVQGLIIRQLDSTDTWAILIWRCLGSIPVLLAIVTWTSGGHPLRAVKASGSAGVIGGLGLVLAFSGAIYAMQATTIANAVFLFSASPFFAAILGLLLLREKVRPATWGAIVLAAVGMFVMVRQGLALGELDGNIAALTSAFGFAGFTVALRWKRLPDMMHDMMPAVLIGAVFALVAGLLMQAVRGESLLLSPQDAGIAMLLGAVIVATGLAMYTLGASAIPAAELTLLSQIEVLLSPIWVLLFLNEAATGTTFLGGAILTAAVVFNGLSGARRVSVLARRSG